MTDRDLTRRPRAAARVLVAALVVSLLATAFYSLGPGPDGQRGRAVAHAGISYARAVHIMRGTIAAECPGRNHAICFERHDALVYRSEAHCWGWNSGYTHKEGNWPWGLYARWYGSVGTICHGRVLYHREFRG